MAIKRALISVSDKRGLVKFAKALEEKGVKILSTGGTAKEIRDGGVKVIDVSDYTGFPEMMSGRVKTLHPKVHGGILALRSDKKHMEEARKNDVNMIDMVVVNLYPFQKEPCIENIDIGGPSMIRSAAKNFEFVTVVCDPDDYEKVAKEIEKHGDTNLRMREKLARKAFGMTAKYDEAIGKYFREKLGEPELLDLHYEKVCSLRYGENPQQKAAFFRNPESRGANITNAKVLHGRQLSFNNLVDGDSALELVKEFKEPAVVFVKHNNPCGVAVNGKIEKAFVEAHMVDPMSAFGSVIALNREVNEKIVDYIFKKKIFVEMIVAPAYAKGALKKLMRKPNLRILETGKFNGHSIIKSDIKKVTGGLLIQTKDLYQLKPSDLKVVTKKKPTKAEVESMLFATKVVKHVMSNAIVMAKGTVATGIGAGQMSRVDSVMLAGKKGGKRVRGSVMASDAFFPFADGVEAAHKLGVKAIIQPGGSVRDAEIIKTADKLGMSMVFTGRRYFRH